MRPSTVLGAVRAYSAHAGLNQEEVQGRILDLLKNFDKVTDTSKVGSAVLGQPDTLKAMLTRM